MLVKKPRKETRTGCEAHMTIGLQPNGKYTIIDFEANHNHKLADQSYAYILSSQRQIAPAQAIEFELADDSGIRPKLAFKLMGRRVGVQTDIEDQITNMFWADAKMVLDYGCFGDVLFFDTIYRTNKECRPFGAFVELNHHYQQVVFGASLLYDETAASFEWLFETFLNCMSGKKPKTIYTDQDAAMHARDVYTGTIFDMFQDEYEKSLLVIVDECFQTRQIYEYRVSLCGHSRQHTITFTSVDGTISCSCKNFEFVGILCCHALKVLDDLKMKLMIPERYILKRWTKNARAGFVTDVHGREIQENHNLEVGARYNNLCNMYVKLVGKGAASREACDLLENNASELCAKLEEILMVQSPSET
ncbi:hypothetical protein L1049_018946 [Liquidambar formosana]|uniref:Protein FAR1-RELATED SEQUENCE n=1 Tax=Liquidambar formosana TaxID=63359 RepID=A0AAP0WMG0_LIQFO